MLVDLPSPSRINWAWNLGSMLAACLGVQLVTGLIMARAYTASTELAFGSVDAINREVWFGWLFRFLHANGARAFFICLYGHMMRGLYFNGFRSYDVWGVGVLMLLLVMGTAFLGYVLPWGQMSFWAATVITNFIRAIPYVGGDVVIWVWGGFAVGGPTLGRFYMLHFLLPFVIAGFTMVHLVLLHSRGSKNPLGVERYVDKVCFRPLFAFKDLLGVVLLLWGLVAVCMYCPTIFMDAENFIMANQLVTPTHIKPEWYFLFGYAVLRSVPNKLGGIIAMVGAIALFWLAPVVWGGYTHRVAWGAARRVVFWWFIARFLVLTWIGGCHVIPPYVVIGQIFSVAYFGLFLVAMPLAMAI